jgi:LmbE family N-acetylglucosaminyl deacetylase
MGTILLVFAHPDDESFTCAGVVAKYVRTGWTADLVCATRGESGERGPYDQASKRQLGNIRTEELERAAKILGISSVTNLQYKDGVLKAVLPGELEDTLFKIMIKRTPSVVLTYEPGGISNHPDHIKVTTATTVAFQKYAEAIREVRKKQISVDNPPRHARDKWQVPLAQAVGSDFEPKLYYACLPTDIARYLVREKIMPHESFGKPWSTTLDKLITTVIDISKYQKKKIRALQSHVSQRKDIDRFLSIANQPLLMKEFFILRYRGLHEVFMGKNDRVADRL